MNDKKTFLKSFPILFIGNIYLCALDDWHMRDFISLGITTLAGAIAWFYCCRKPAR